MLKMFWTTSFLVLTTSFLALISMLQITEGKTYLPMIAITLALHGGEDTVPDVPDDDPEYNCENCKDRGYIGDGTVKTDCPECDLAWEYGQSQVSWQTELTLPRIGPAFVLYVSDGCDHCERMHNEINADKSLVRELQYYDCVVHNISESRSNRYVTATPTMLILDIEGKELGRIPERVSTAVVLKWLMSKKETEL